MPRPDFFLVGALKSGTSAMASYLGQHPDIYLPVKEVCFFGSDLEFRRTLQRSGDWFQPAEDRYLSFFDAAPAGARVGEATAYYLFSALAAREIESFSPGASIIVMLRNPVDMIHSMHKHWLFSLNEDVTDLSEALALEEERRRGRCIPDSVFWPQGLQYRSIPRYAEQLERYFDVFGRERVHVILFDDFRSDARDAYRRTLEFLGADPEFEPAFEAKNALPRPTGLDPGRGSPGSREPAVAETDRRIGSEAEHPGGPLARDDPRAPRGPHRILPSGSGAAESPPPARPVLLDSLSVGAKAVTAGRTSTCAITALAREALCPSQGMKRASPSRA
jgi:hypothetical protein